MSRIKSALRKKYPDKSGLLLPTVLFDRTDIRQDDEISASYAALRHRLGGQYAWLAMWAKQQGMHGVELVIEKTDSSVGCLPVIREYLVKTEKGLVIDEQYMGTDVYALFRHYLFAITDVSKMEMRAIARDRGFEDLLHMSWYCHRPKFSSLPCGTCNPCISTRHKGLGYRIGPYGNLMYFLATACDLRRYVKKGSGLYAWMKRLKGMGER